jgi:hypothetical protein
MICVMGGWSGSLAPLNQNYAYSPRKDNWTIAASLPIAWAGYAAAGVNDLLYVIGRSDDGLTTKVWQYTSIGYGTPDPTYGQNEILSLMTTFLAAVSLISVTVIVAGLLVYFRKRKRGQPT